MRGKLTREKVWLKCLVKLLWRWWQFVFFFNKRKWKIGSFHSQNNSRFFFLFSDCHCHPRSFDRCSRWLFFQIYRCNCYFVATETVLTDFGRLWRINMFHPFHRKSLLGPESMLLLCAWRGKRWHLSVFFVHFRNEAKTAVLQNAQNLNSLADVTGSNPALARHYLRDLSLVDTKLTPPGFVTSQLVVTCGIAGLNPAGFVFGGHEFISSLICESPTSCLLSVGFSTLLWLFDLLLSIHNP